MACGGLAEGRGCEPRGVGRCMNNCGGGLDLSVALPKDGDRTGYKKEKETVVGNSAKKNGAQKKGFPSLGCGFEMWTLKDSSAKVMAD